MKLSNRSAVSKARTWVEISKDALLSNISQIRKILPPKAKFMAMVKANAYGHGLLEVAQTIKNKVDYFAVFTFEDALLLRQNKVNKPLLVLSQINFEQIDLAIKHDIEIMVSSLDFLKQICHPGVQPKDLRSKSRNLKIHICVDSGLGRDGFAFAELEKVVSILKKSPSQVVGLYGHFASADDKKFDLYSAAQIEKLLLWKNEFAATGIKPKLIHHQASAGTLYGCNHPEFNLARIGIALYGLWPSDLRNKSVKLKSVLSWKARISEVKFLPKGSAISYGCTHILARDSKLALLPVGYFDGVSRIASNKAEVILCGKKVRQIGRVTMNLLVLDVTNLKDVKVGDVATIIGEKVSANEWAKWSETTNYEVVTRINPGIIRVQS